MTNWPQTVKERPQQQRRARVIGDGALSEDEIAKRKQAAMRKLIAMISVAVGLVLSYAWYRSRVAEVDATAASQRVSASVSASMAVRIQELPNRWKYLASRGDKIVRDAHNRMRSLREGEGEAVRAECLKDIAAVVKEAKDLNEEIQSTSELSPSLREDLGRAIEGHVSEWDNVYRQIKRAGQ